MTAQPRPRYSTDQLMGAGPPPGYRADDENRLTESSASNPSPRAELERMDRRLAELGRSGGRARLEIGETLERFNRLAGHIEMGCPTLGAYGRQFLGQTQRWCNESASLARRLEHLPLLRAALASGRMGWSKVDLLARHATPDNEAELLVDAKGKTVRALREAFAAQAEAEREARKPEEPEPEPEAPPPTLRDLVKKPEKVPSPFWNMTFGPATLRLALPEETEVCVVGSTVPAERAIAYDLMRILLKGTTQVWKHHDLVEAMLAEGSVTLSMLAPRQGVPLGPPPDATAEWREEWRQQQNAIEAALEGALSLDFDKDLGPLDGMDTQSTDVHTLHERLQKLALAYAARDLEIGTLTRTFWAEDGWRRLGFQHASQYARERVGVSLRSLQQRMKLARRFDLGEPMAPVKKALLDGDIGFESALLIVRATDRGRVEFAEPWVERAKERTVVALREELDIAEMYARVRGSIDHMKPPSAAQVAEYRKTRSAVLSGEAFEKPAEPANDEPSTFQPVGIRAQISGADSAPAPGNDDADIRDAPHPPKPGTGMRQVRLSMDPDQARWWRCLERHYRTASCEHDLPESFLEFLVQSTLQAWLPWVYHPGNNAYFAVHVRDGFECQNPVCDSSNVTCHHIVFRSSGGGEEPSNLISLCWTCHSTLLHGNKIRLEGDADNRLWLLGRVPVMEVADDTVKAA